MGEQDGQTVTSEVSTGTTPPTVEVPTAAAPVDPEAKIKAIVAEALKAQEAELARKIQSEADKRVAPLQRRLSEAERRAYLAEGTLQTLPGRLGDLDPDVQQRIRLAQAEGRLNLYDQERQAQARAQQEELEKQQFHAETRQRIAKLGLNPDDPRIKYDLNAPSAHDYLEGVMASVAKIKEDDATKNLDALITQKITERDAKARRESGVDSHETAGAAGSGPRTFTRAQIRDRKFYEANREAIDKASREGRIKE
jgi:hypothetical protein